MLRFHRSQSTAQRVFGAFGIWAIAIALGGILGIFTRLPLPSIALLVVGSITSLATALLSVPCYSALCCVSKPPQLDPVSSMAHRRRRCVSVLR